MKRLNYRAFEILKQEIDRYSKNDILAQTGRDIVGRRLERLLREEGQPLNAAELQEILKDFFPNFNKEVLKKAAKANQPPSIWGKLVWAPVALVGGVGVIWFLNLPYPMIRRPVARVAPMVLFPSYMSMDYNYRQAVAKVEQADQLVNKATSAADIDLGAEKVTQAQGHLDALPVWFLGYYPQRYCTFFSCSWKFTFDEFERARKQIGRMEAKVFQEKNALTMLAEAEESLNIAREQFQQTETLTEKQEAIANWQAAIDVLERVPPSTFAGKNARSQLSAAKRDFQQEAGITRGNRSSLTFIEAAKQFGMLAAKASQNPPHTAQQWQQIAELWQEAINRLKKVPEDNSGYLEAQGKLAEYQANLANVTVWLQNEKDSVNAMKKAKDLIASWQRDALSDSPNVGLLTSKLQLIINQLELVQPGTTVSAEAQELLQFANNKLQELNK